MKNIMIRKITENEDFERLLQMMNDTAKRFNPDPKFYGFGMTSQELKKDYSKPNDSHGFVAVDNGMIVAFMGVYLSPITKNGHLVCGYIEGYEANLNDLVSKCLLVVRENGGSKLFNFASSKFGQIRNSEITFWEKLGFYSEEYANVTLMLSINEWNEPTGFNKSNIALVSNEELDLIKQLLVEDGESSTAELIDNNLSKKHVILSLRDEHSGEITGLVHYYVDLVNKGTTNEFLDAYAFTIHFRPRYDLSKLEKRRLLHAALLSAKQLGVYHVITRITLKNFEVFSLLIREGFDDVGMEKNSTINLYKTV